MRYKKIQLFILLITLPMLYSIGCVETPAPGTNYRLRIVETEPDYDFVSDSVSRFLIRWDARPGATNVIMWIMLYPERWQIPDEPAVGIDMTTAGSRWMMWSGRKYGAGYGTRTTPVPLGLQRIVVATSGAGGDTSGQLSVYFVANQYDSDADDFSDAVEDENNGVTGMQTPIIDENGSTQYGWFVRTNGSLPPTIPTTISTSNLLYPNRGTHDYSLARGTASNGSLHNGLRIANSSTGYYYFSGRDPHDYDNWGVLMTINNIERVGRRWRNLYQTGAGVGSGDISLSAGGYWSDHPGGTHQRGLDVDLRYMRTDNTEQNFSFGIHPQSDFHFQKTYDLVQLFVQAGANRIIVDARTSFTATSVIVLETPGTGPHNTHFHVEFPDPDGNN